MGFISTHEHKNYGRWANLKALNTLALERSLLHQMFMINDLTFAHLATQITTSIERLSSKTGTDKWKDNTQSSGKREVGHFASFEIVISIAQERILEPYNCHNATVAGASPGLQSQQVFLWTSKHHPSNWRWNVSKLAGWLNRLDKSLCIEAFGCLWSIRKGIWGKEKQFAIPKPKSPNLTSLFPQK